LRDRAGCLGKSIARQGWLHDIVGCAARAGCVVGLDKRPDNLRLIRDPAIAFSALFASN
jgi:hypothetical protein